MALGKIFASPIATMIAGGLDTFTKNYWENVVPEDKAEIEKFKTFFKTAKNNHSASVTTGQQLLDKLRKKADVLKTMTDFKDVPEEVLIKTIELVEASGLAEKGKEVEYLIKNPNAYKIKSKAQIDKENQNIAQTKSALDGSFITKGSSLETPPVENRGAFMTLLHGRSTRAIQDTALRELGYTRKDLEYFLKPKVAKSLGTTTSAIEFKLQKGEDPLVSTIVDALSDNLKSINELDFEVTNADGKAENAFVATAKIIAKLKEDGEVTDDNMNAINGLITTMAEQDVPGFSETLTTVQSVLTEALKFVGHKTPGLSEARTEATIQINKLLPMMLTIHQKKTAKEKLNEINEMAEIAAELSKLVVQQPIELSGVFINGTDRQELLSLVTNIMKINKDMLVDLPNGKKISINEVGQELLGLLNKAPGKLTQTDLTRVRTLQDSLFLFTPPKGIEESDIFLSSQHKIIQTLLAEAPGAAEVDEQLRNQYLNAFDAAKAKGFQDKALNSALFKLQQQLILTVPKTEEFMARSENATKLTKDLFTTLEGQLRDSKSPSYSKNLQKLHTSISDIKKLYKSNLITLEDFDNKMDQFNRLMANLIVNKENPYENRVNEIVTQIDDITSAVLKNPNNEFTVELIEEMLNLQRNVKTLAETPIDSSLEGEELEEAEESRLAALVDAQSEFIKITMMQNMEKPTLSETEEKIELMVNYVKRQRESRGEVPLTAEEEEALRAKIGVDLVNDKVIIIDGQPYRQTPTTNGIVVTQVDKYFSSGQKEIFSKKQIDEKKIKYGKQVESSVNISKVVNAYFEDSNFTNFVGQFKFLISDGRDLINAISGTRGKEELPGFNIQSAQVGRTSSIGLLGSAKDLIFDDPRLSDQDLDIVMDYIIAIRKGGIIGERRGVAGLSIIHGMQIQKAILNQYDIDQKRTQPLIVRFKPLSEEELSKLSSYDKTLYKIEEKLGFQITDKAGANHTKTMFGRVMSHLGTRILTKEQVEKLSRKEMNKYSDQLDYAIGVMKIATSEIDLYANNGVDKRNEISSYYLSQSLAINEDNGAPTIFNDLVYKKADGVSEELVGMPINWEEEREKIRAELINLNTDEEQG